MSIPTHNISCITKAFRTKCPDCGDGVWFFSCSCGSRVYFEELGWPWTQHYCKNYAIREAIEMIRDFERYTDDEIYQVVEDYSKKHAQQISDEVWEMLEYELGKRTTPFTYSEVDCIPDMEILTGQVLAINRSINFYKKFNLKKESPFSDGLLGKLTDNVYHEVIIREQPDKNNHSNQYKAYIRREKVSGRKIKKGDKILAEVSFISLPPGNIWEIVTFEVY